MEGISETRFGYDRRLTFGEMYVAAAKLHVMYMFGGDLDQIEQGAARLARTLGWPVPECETDLAVDYLRERGVISEFDWEDYYWFGLADEFVTRAEMAKAAGRILSAADMKETREYKGFSDLKKTDVAYASIVTLYEAGIYNSVSGSRFAPYSYITRGDAAAVFAKMLLPDLRG
jgi:hypothetical protein